MTDLIRNAPAKPIKGTALLAKRKARKDWKAAEQQVRKAVQKRDEGRCRFPRCPYKTLPVDWCHRRDSHRGMGGSRSLGKTTIDGSLLLCRIHHGYYDGFDLDIEPLTARGFNDRCAFYVRSATGELVQVASEQRIGVSVTRS